MKNILLRKIKGFFIKEVIKNNTIIVSDFSLLEGKTALVIGGAGGIGFGIAKELLRSGANVILAGRNVEKLKLSCNKLGEKSKYIIIDVCNIEDLKCKINSLDTFFSDIKKIDILINSAGIHGVDSFGGINENDFDNVLDTNLKGVYFSCQIMANYYIKNKIKGHILNVSSASALKPAWTPYELSKWGIRGLTLGFADKLIKYGIIVNAIAPGPVSTSMLGKDENSDISWRGNPSGRMATPDEIGRLAVLMVSDMGQLIVGDSYYISGGSGTICIDR